MLACEFESHLRLEKSIQTCSRLAIFSITGISIQSEQVKKWRKATKNRIIEAMGGSCVCCGYNACGHSLALHHLNPEKKDLGLGAIRASAISWERIVVELRKCILVCHNCHGEIHAGIRFVPEKCKGFDESFSSYKDLEKVKKDYCPVCGKLKPTYQITCSRSCAGQNRYKINWNDIDLEQELKIKSVLAIAEGLGCSDAAVHKRLKKLKLK